MTPPNLDSAKLKKEIEKHCFDVKEGNQCKCNSLYLAVKLLKANWIHRSQALEVVEVCRNCSGQGKMKLWHEGHVYAKDMCPTCQGRGIVLKEE